MKKRVLQGKRNKKGQMYTAARLEAAVKNRAIKPRKKKKKAASLRT